MTTAVPYVGPPGRVLRLISGRGIAVGFLVVAITFLSVTMLGWRLVAEVVLLLRQVHVVQVRSILAVPELAGLADELLQSRVDGPDAQQAFPGLNREFHLTLYRAAGSPTLLRLLTDLSAQAERMRLHFDVRRGRAGDDHARILAALAARDVEEAVTATRDHILGALVIMMPAGFEVTAGSTLDLALRASGSGGPAQL